MLCSNCDYYYGHCRCTSFDDDNVVASIADVIIVIISIVFAGYSELSNGEWWKLFFLDTFSPFSRLLQFLLLTLCQDHYFFQTQFFLQTVNRAYDDGLDREACKMPQSIYIFLNSATRKSTSKTAFLVFWYRTFPASETARKLNFFKLFNNKISTLK